ncbi:MAG: 50S ribosomal protein L3 [Clostridiales bacterium]|nr:50S ribosomal protein L3 [Clostridiales bacterium]
MRGLMGKKVGMTQVFNEEGAVIPVTVIHVEPNVVTQVKNVESDGYHSVQIAYGEIKEKNVNKPLKGHFAKAGVSPKRKLKEIRLQEASELTPGQELTVEIFKVGDKVDISGISKGKGFQGVIKRHGQSRGPETHGSRYHRAPGSMGASATPARVLKGKKLPGQMGREKITVQNLEIVKVDAERNALLVKGAVPGPKKGILFIQETIKKGK